jgi:hypothetical protein
MKMIWSWWPNVGFEPRYGGDVAAGAFAIANFLAYGENMSAIKSELETIQQRIRTLGPEDSPKVMLTYANELELLKNCTIDFEDGWYSIAVAKLNQAEKIIEQLTAELKTLSSIQSLKSLNQIETASIVALFMIFVTVTSYLLRKLTPTHHGK